MFHRAPDSRERAEEGQVLIIVALGLVVMIAMVGLIVDGGHAWGQFRDTQNGSDAAALAGATEMARNIPYQALGQVGPATDADVEAAVLDAMDANSVDITVAYYADAYGDRLAGDIQVGSLGAASPPAGAAGVEVTANKDFDTFLMGIIGFQSLTAEAEATAISGYIQDVCDAALGCNVLPVIFPFSPFFCDGTNSLEWSTESTEWPTNVEFTIPLCSSGPGNVGWLDWDPPAGGTNELADAIENPNNPSIQIPSWQYISESGNINAGQVQTALEAWIGKPVMIPMFDETCDSDPGSGSNPCPTGPGNGQNQWYHIPQFAGFVISEVHISGSGGPGTCGSGNGSTGCLVGRFTSFVGPGNVIGPSTGVVDPAIAAIGVQLVH
jgi:hypothetical protein